MNYFVDTLIMSLSTLSWRNDEYHLQDVDQQQCWLEISTLSTQYLHGIIFIYKRPRDVLSQSKCSREGGDCSDKSSTQAHPLPMASSLYSQLWLLMLMMLVDAQIESRFSSIHNDAWYMSRNICSILCWFSRWLNK